MKQLSSNIEYKVYTTQKSRKMLIKQVYFDQELPSKYRKMVINKRYILIYFIKKRSIYIETILDSRQKNSYY